MFVLLALSACAPVSSLPSVDSQLAREEAQKQREIALESLLDKLDQADQ